jgi:hypothetical protein
MTVRLLLALLAFLPLPAQDLRIFFGNLHSHTAYSDGTGTPEQAYTHARQKGGLQFLLISEHNHSQPGSTGDDPQGLLIANDHALYKGPGPHSLIETANRINAQFQGAFVALYGQEYSSNSKGNHTNVLDVGEVIDEDEVPNGRYDRLYQSWLVMHRDSFNKPAIVQFNHPRSVNRDYGMDNFGDIARLLEASRPFVRTIEIINGPHDARPGEPLARVGNIKSGAYLTYLNHGFRLAPTADQDNHFITHGTATDHRTAVLATALTKEAVLEAIRQRRVYATQDKNLEIRFTVNGQIMGSAIPTTPPMPLAIQVDLRDPDEPQANYKVILHRDTVGDEIEARDDLAFRTTTGNSTVTFEEFTYDGGEQYFLIEVIQNPDAATEDRAWTAPVWLVPSDPDIHPPDSPGFVWSRNSGVFHLPTCRDALRIAAENRESGPTPPPGRRVHTGCPR